MKIKQFNNNSKTIKRNSSNNNQIMKVLKEMVKNYLVINNLICKSKNKLNKLDKMMRKNKNRNNNSKLKMLKLVNKDKKKINRSKLKIMDKRINFIRIMNRNHKGL